MGDIKPSVVLMTAYVIQLCSAIGASYSCSVEAGIKQLVCCQNKTTGQDKAEW